MFIAMAQIEPVWMDRQATLVRVESAVREAAAQGAGLVGFGEALVPGYPFWLHHTGGAEFESDLQKDMFAIYQREAVVVADGHLDGVCRVAAEQKIAVVLGIIEADAARGMSLYASVVYIGPDGQIGSVHRKLMPTYEERLVWSPGDGHGLRVHALGDFTVGALNCWENWMPMPRQALYAQGETLHVAIWPGSVRNTEDITQHLAREGRSYVLSVSGMLRPQSVPDGLPVSQQMQSADVYAAGWFASGGSCIAAPDGSWVVPPWEGETGVRIGEIDIHQVRRERQNFDPAGHYSRPDVLRLQVNRERQSTAAFE